MEESTLLSNITTILTKDILVDVKNNLQGLQHFLYTTTPENKCIPSKLFESEDDNEAFTFFLRQNGILMPPKKPRYPECVPSVCTELNLLNKFTATEFESYLHMSKMTFLKIYQSIGVYFRRNVPLQLKHVPPQTVFSLSLWKLATDEHFEEMAHKFTIHLQDCSSIIRYFWFTISKHHNKFFKWPSKVIDQKAIIRGFSSHSSPYVRAFSHLFGVVALQHLNVFLECEDEEVSIVFQIVCNADQKIINCFVELTESYSFDASPIGRTLAGFTERIPSKSYLVGDKNFPLRRYLICPFKAECTEQEKTFNSLLEPILLIAQETLGNMAKRFNMLYALEAKNLTEVRQIVYTLCTLHNHCVDIEDDFVERKRTKTPVSWRDRAKESVIITSELNTEGERRRASLLKKFVG